MEVIPQLKFPLHRWLCVCASFQRKLTVTHSLTWSLLMSIVCRFKWDVDRHLTAGELPPSLLWLRYEMANFCFHSQTQFMKFIDSLQNAVFFFFFFPFFFLMLQDSFIIRLPLGKLASALHTAHSLGIPSSDKQHVSHLLLKDSFTRYRICGWQAFFSQNLKNGPFASCLPGVPGMRNSLSSG